MKKYLKFKFILLIFLINTAYANAQCNLEFDIGDNQSIAFESLGLYEDYIIDTENEKQYSYIEDNYKELCPDGDMEDAKIRVLINEEQVKGIKIISLVDINFQDDEKKLREKKFDIVLTNPPFGKNRSMKPNNSKEKERAEIYELWNIARDGQSIDKGLIFLENTVVNLLDHCLEVKLVSSILCFEISLKNKRRIKSCCNFKIGLSVVF